MYIIVRNVRSPARGVSLFSRFLVFFSRLCGGTSSSNLTHANKLNNKNAIDIDLDIDIVQR